MNIEKSLHSIIHMTGIWVRFCLQNCNISIFLKNEECSYFCTTNWSPFFSRFLIQCYWCCPSKAFLSTGRSSSQDGSEGELELSQCDGPRTPPVSFRVWLIGSALIGRLTQPAWCWLSFHLQGGLSTSNGILTQSEETEEWSGKF